VRNVLIVLALIPVLIWGIWIAIPGSSLQDRIEGSVNDRNFYLETEGLKKGLFYRVAIDRLTLNGYGREQVSFQDIQAPIKLLALLRLQLNVPFDGEIGQGAVSGTIIRTMNEKKLEMTVEEAPMSDFPFLHHAGIEGSGTLSGRCTMINRTGHVEFVTHDAQFQPVVFSNITVPLNFFTSVRGALDIKEDVIYIPSIALEGKDIYARISGEIDETSVDLSMEIMPGKSFLDNPLFINTFRKYEISPGYYVIHIKRDIRAIIRS
jgi:type II secretion system protein N